MNDTDLIAEARKASRAVYLATDADVADDISRIILGLVAEVSALREVIEKVHVWRRAPLKQYASGKDRDWGALRAILASVPAVASPETPEDADEGYVSRFRENPNAKNGFHDA